MSPIQLGDIVYKDGFPTKVGRVVAITLTQTTDQWGRPAFSKSGVPLLNPPTYIVRRLDGSTFELWAGNACRYQALVDTARETLSRHQAVMDAFQTGASV